MTTPAELPVNVDATYADDGADASVKAHQQHHDTVHAFVKKAGPMVTAKTADFTAVPGDYVLASGTFTVTLPAASINTQVTVVNTGSGTITVVGTGGALINGDANATLVSRGAGGTFTASGTEWWVPLETGSPVRSATSTTSVALGYGLTTAATLVGLSNAQVGFGYALTSTTQADGVSTATVGLGYSLTSATSSVAVSNTSVGLGYALISATASAAESTTALRVGYAVTSSTTTAITNDAASANLTTDDGAATLITGA